MRTFTTVCCHWYDKWRREVACTFKVLTTLLFLCTFLLTTQTQAQSLNLDQGANGAYTDPLSVRNPVKWQNGNLNQQQSHLIEGHSVPYRLIVGNLTPGQTYTITLGYDMVNSGKYALDFITGYDNLEPHTFTATGGHTGAEDIFPFGDGTTYVAPSDEMAITLPSYLAINNDNNKVAPKDALTKINDYWNSLPASAKKMSIWGGQFVDAFGIQYAYFENSAPISADQVLNLSKGETKVEFTIQFTASEPQATIAWGGHIANRLQWSYNTLGEPNSAGGLTGSPYHMRTITGGNQDRSLKVALSGPICPTDLPVNAVSLCANSSYVNMPLGQCPDNVCVGTPLYFNIPAQSGALTYTWTVTKDGNATVLFSGANAQFSFTPATGGEYTVTVVLGNESGFQATCSQSITVITVTANEASSSLCETVAGGGTAQFDLTTLESTVIGNQTGVTGVTWYTDAGLTNQISPANAYTSSSTTVYAKVNKGDCYASAAVNLTVKPRPVTTVPEALALCNGQSSSGFTFGSNVEGSTYAWTSSINIGFGLSGTGAIPSFTAANNGTTPIIATVSVKATANGCEGPAKTFTITVNPTPTVDQEDNQTLCAGARTLAVSFSGAVSGTVFTWTNNNTNIGLGSSGTGTIPSFTATNSGTTPISATITVTPSYTNAGANCQGQSITFTITVNPAPRVNAVANRVHCNGEAGAAITFGSNISGSTFAWTSTADVGFGLSGTGNIDPYTAVNNTNAPITATVSVRATASGCQGPVRSFIVRVLPTPKVNKPANQVVCNGSMTSAINFTGTATAYNWTNNRPGIGLAASGTGNIGSFQAVNTGTTPVTATITVTPVYVLGSKTCTGTSQSFTITVKPTPSVNAVANRVHCNGEAGAAITFGSNISGSTFAWTSTADVGFGLSGTGNIDPYTAVNNTNAPITATVSVRATASGCQGPVTTFEVTVNPTPTVDQPASITLCNGATTDPINFTDAVSGTVYNWSNSDTSIGLGSSGTGTIPSFAVTNNGTAPVTATITVTPSYSNGGKTCTGEAKTFTITVNPTPTVNQPPHITACNGDNIPAITFSGTATAFSWTTSGANIGMNALCPPPSGSCLQIPSFTAVNNTNTPVVTTVTVTPYYTYNGVTCTGASTSFNITVNPTPSVNPVDDRSHCAGEAAGAINFGSNVSGAIFNWTSTVDVGFGTSGTGNISAYTAVNNTTAPITAVVSVRSTANGCQGPASTFKVTVNPNPVLVITNPPQTCAPNTVDLTASSVTAGSTLLGGTLTYWQDSAATLPLANPNAVAVGGTYYIKVTTTAGCYDIEPVVVSIIQCTYCTYTQGAYGSDGGKACIGEPNSPKLSTYELIKHSITNWGLLRIGTNARYIDISASDLDIKSVIKYLPGGGSSYSFKPEHKNGFISDPAVKFQDLYTKKAGKNYRINNTLLAQTITLGLNMGIRSNLDDLVLQGNMYLVTVDPLNGCGSTTAKTCTYDPVNDTLIDDPHTYKWIDGAVVNAIAGPKTVGGLFNLANRALADEDGIAGSEGGVSLSQIASVVDNINNAFDECKLLAGYSATNSVCPETPASYTVTASENVESELSVDKLQVYAAPNPFKDKVRFTIASPVSGQGSLEVFNLLGQKLETVYQGYLMAGRGQTVEYSVPQANRTTLIYVLKVGGQQVTGKLINVR